MQQYVLSFCLKGFTLPFLPSSSFYLPVGTAQESGPKYRLLLSLSKL